MAARAGIVLVALLAGLAGPVSDTVARPSTSLARVERVVDGDTVVLAGGSRVRLVQIDTPEPGTAECYSRAAGRDLRRMLPAGAVVTLEADPALDQVDRYGRLLRYVHRAGRNLNLALVRAADREASAAADGNFQIQISAPPNSREVAIQVSDSQGNVSNYRVPLTR